LQKKREKFCQWHFFQSSTGADYKWDQNERTGSGSRHHYHQK
jgi:hypothetical protein